VPAFMNHLRQGDILIFCDHSSRKPVEEGVNQIAVVINETQALFVEGGLVRKLDLELIPQLANLQIRRGLEAKDAPKVADYFAGHANQPAHFEAGLKALLLHNLQPLVDGSLFPVRPKYENERVYRQAWQSFNRNLRPFGCIFTTCLSSFSSRAIAKLTGGPWSHVALYVGEGRIAESITSGLRYAPLDVYRGQQNWVACYRRIEFMNTSPSVEMTENIAKATAEEFAQGYSYLKASWYGLRAFLGDHSHALVPNSMIFQGDYVLIAHV
jgi:hypothetical protein